MTLLHVYFTLRNQQAFQRLLERDRSPGVYVTSRQAGGGQSSTSAGKSWTRKNMMTLASALEVNAYDHLGRTVLHLACSSTDPAGLEYARMLLAHPAINVNILDKENHWTALHRALYTGNVEAAIMLLKRTDMDTSIKDLEGYTAFDVYNSTVQNANPTTLEEGYADSLTWGANRNAALGLGDSNDRIHPDHVVILKKNAPFPATRSLEERFRPVKVRDIRMSKLHTVFLTDEPRDNVRLCGFGSGGRLGPFPHTLYTPAPLSLFSHTIVSVALGQDHTLALTSAGEVISWGLNRFAQLGYAIESGPGGTADELIQTTPRKISHLKKETIEGIAACKTASACWSDADVWTWGTNGGQLGYGKTASPIQILPRKASIITQPIRGISMSEMAMVCLFKTGEVLCIWNGGVSKISFPAHAFPSDISAVYRPPQAIRGPMITKLVCCDDTFAALSSNGEVFTFSFPNTGEREAGIPGGARAHQVKPQRLWALRRQFSSVRDVDIGGDGSVIICTQSGHVYVRSRNLKSSTSTGGGGAKTFKFHRVAHVQRAVAVCANSTGAFGALRVEYRPPPISLGGRHFSADLATISPFVCTILLHHDVHATSNVNNVDAEDDPEDSSILDDIGKLAKLMAILESPSRNDSKYGADLMLRVDPDFEISAHRVVLATRCIPLREVLGGAGGTLSDQSSKVSVTFTLQQLHFTGVAPFSLLILLRYLYADEVLAIWDPRIGCCFDAQLSRLGLSTAQIKAELGALARLLSLSHLVSALQFVGKHAATSSASRDFQWLFDQAQCPRSDSSRRRNVCQDPLAPDVALRFADDRIVYTHSVVLRARSEFFEALFTDPEWTAERKDDNGVVDVQMGHLNWQVVEFVFAFVCFGEETSFEVLEFVNNVDELLEFMFLVISAANELLLTRLILLCSQIVLKYLNFYNACYLLTEAIHLNAVDLADRIQSYMTANMEMLLESRILDDLDTRVVRKLSEHARAEQAAQSPVSRSERLGRTAMEKHKEWLALQDIPSVVVPTGHRLWNTGKSDSPKMSPPPSSLVKKARMAERLVTVTNSPSPLASPVLRPSMPPPVGGDDIFTMDDDAEPTTSLRAGGEDNTTLLFSTGHHGGAAMKVGWKRSPATPRTDLKAIMAEAENGKRQAHTRTIGDQQGSATSGSAVSVRSGDTTRTPQSPAMNVQQSDSAGGTSPARLGLGALSERWRSEAPPTPTSTPPRRVLSDLGIPVKSSEAGVGSTPTRMASRGATAATQAAVVLLASPEPLRASNMGPVITPVRQTPSGGSRKPSLGGAWTLPPVQPIAAPTVSTTTTTTPVSFAEIQRQEMQGTSLSASKVKRSLREIQEEERARQREADFLTWWAAEEERVRLEMEAAETETEPAMAMAMGTEQRPRGTTSGRGGERAATMGNGGGSSSSKAKVKGGRGGRAKSRRGAGAGAGGRTSGRTELRESDSREGHAGKTLSSKQPRR